MRQKKDCREYIYSEDYIDLFLDTNQVGSEKILADNCYINIDHDFVIYFKKTNGCGEGMESPYIKDVYYGQIPFLYTLNGYITETVSKPATDFAGPTFGETGKGAIIGVISTGINYEHEAFVTDGKSKIIEIWDQTIKGEVSDVIPYGTVFNNQQINDAISQEKPLPTKDDVGFGTMIAGIAVGNEDINNNFAGVAPEAELLIVKLKEAKKCIKNFLEVPPGGVAYQESDIFLAMNYLLERGKFYKKPIVILIPIESNAGSHDGATAFEIALDIIGGKENTVVVVTAGNEANQNHHYEGHFSPIHADTTPVRHVNMDVHEKNFVINMFNYIPDIFVVEIVSPTGESTGKISIKPNKWNEFVLGEVSKVIVHYAVYEEYSGDQVTHMHFYNAETGLWTINVYGEEIANGRFDMWIYDYYIQRDKVNVEFLEPSPYTTVTTPSTTRYTITVGAYNTLYNSILASSGRGNTRSFKPKPDIVAPGVNLLAPYIKDNTSYAMLTGCSGATAVVAAASALLLSMNSKKYSHYMNTMTMRTYLTRGAKRNPIRNYPSRLWGYGELDIEKSMMGLED